MSARALGCVVAAVALSASATSAQSVRVTGSTHVRYIELRPLERDSVAAESVPGTGLMRQHADGRILRCIPGEAFCYDTRAGDPVSTLPAITDVEASAWGFGQGIRLYAHVRGRTSWGGNTDLWPRGDDAFDLLAAWADLERGRVRARIGRQWRISGLGFYNFDGLSVGVRPHVTTSIDAYVGRSLLRGLNEPRTTGALESVEALAPPSAGLLTGIQLRYRPHTQLSLGATYQVDFRDDGAGLYSELFAADATLRVGNASAEAALEVDAASAIVNEARLYLRSPPLGHFALSAELRRYVPYFELWTIWGAFSPVGFDEARAGVTWATPDGRIVVRGDGSYRRYGETSAETGLDVMRDDGWAASAAASWAVDTQWRIDAAYRVETGVGAARRDGHAGVQRQFGAGGSLAVQALAFQRLYEFRVTEGTVLGLGAEAIYPLSTRAQIAGNAAIYRHVGSGAGADTEWNQRRASIRLQWTVGAEPGLAGSGR